MPRPGAEARGVTASTWSSQDRPPGFSLPDPPSVEELSRCVQCGLCQNACPTFRELRIETASPRGRLYLMRALGEGRLQPSARLAEHLDLCLGCRACEAACPSGVPFGRLLEATRSELIRRRPPGRLARLARHLLLGGLLAHPWSLELLAGLCRVYLRSGLARLVRPLLPEPVRRAEALLPPLSSRPFRLKELPADGPEPAAALFVGCVMRVAFAEVHRASARLLRQAGWRPTAPRGQVCCGALQAHAGERELARRLARRNLLAFQPSSGPIVVNSAGCGAFLKEYGHLLAGDPTLAEAARRFGARVRDLSEVLVEREQPAPPGRLEWRLAYQDACHLLHAQRIRQQPRQLLSQVLAAPPMELRDGEICCGSAGLYNLTQPDLSRRLLEQKVRAIAASGAEVVVSANPGCLIQLRAGLAEADSQVRCLHLAEVLDAAYPPA